MHLLRPIAFAVLLASAGCDERSAFVGTYSGEMLFFFTWDNGEDAGSRRGDSKLTVDLDLGSERLRLTGGAAAGLRNCSLFAFLTSWTRYRIEEKTCDGSDSFQGGVTCDLRIVWQRGEGLLANDALTSRYQGTGAYSRCSDGQTRRGYKLVVSEALTREGMVDGGGRLPMDGGTGGPPEEEGTPWFTPPGGN